MLVRRKGSKKRGKKCYKALEFEYNLNPKEISAFLGNLGKLEIRGEDSILYSMWIETRDGRKIGPGQYLLKDERRKRIISFDQTIFYDWFEKWNI